MFEFVDEQSDSVVAITDVCEELALFYDAHGRDKRFSDIHPAQHEKSSLNILRKMDISESARDDVNAVLNEAKAEKKVIEKQIALQDAAIKESQEMIKTAMVSYTEAVVASNDDLVKHVEERVDQLEKNIKWAGIRKASFKKELNQLDRPLYCLERIFSYVERGLLIIEAEKAEEVYQAQLAKFVDHFETYYKVVMLLHRRGDSRERFVGDVYAALGAWKR